MRLRANKFILLPLLFSLALTCQSAPIISLLTAGPTDEEAFFLYGHTGIRVQIPERDFDGVYNYGYFSMDQPNFMLNFILGKPLYMLGVTPMSLFLEGYGRGGRSVTEQVINLREGEAEALVHFLEWNARPENAQYRYNFFFDNCATRPRDLIEKYSGGINYHTDSLTLPTFREGAREKSHYAQWYTYGTDIALGIKSDKQMTVRDAAYLPDLLMKELSTATRADDGTPIVLSTRELLPQTLGLKETTPYMPVVVFGSLVVIFAILYFFFAEKCRIPLTVITTVVFAALGLFGITLWFLALFSAHPHMSPNFNMLLYHPFWFLLIPFLFMKQKRYSTLYRDILFWGTISSLLLLAFIMLAPGGQVVPKGQSILWLLALLLTFFTFFPDPKKIEPRHE